MRIDYSIDPTVDLGQAYRLVMHARGYIASNLRQEITVCAEWDVRRANWLAYGQDRHKAVKRARDVRRQVRRLELERMGWK